ncbi:hypothetical protein ACFQVA_20090 [Actinomadura keratinilytica]
MAGARWAGRFAPGAVRRGGAEVLAKVPVVDVHESSPSPGATGPPSSTHPSRARRSGRPRPAGDPVVRRRGRRLAVLPRYLCEEALLRGELVTLLEPPVPPLRTYFVAVRAGTQALPHIATAHEWLLRAAVAWG